MKKTYAVFGLVCALVAFIGCDTGTTDKKENSITTIVPLFNFSTSSGRAVIAATETYDNAVYSFMAPALTGFTTVADGISEGEVLTQSILGTNIDITVTSFSGGANGIASGVRFSGHLVDDSGSVLLEFNPTTKSFYYEEKLFIDDPNGVINYDPANPENPISPKRVTVFYKLNGTLDDTNSCLANASTAILIEELDVTPGDEEFAFAIQILRNLEVYMGVWEPDSAVTGSGIAGRFGGSVLSASFATYGSLVTPTQPISKTSLASDVSYLKACLADDSILTVEEMNQVFYRKSTDTTATSFQFPVGTALSEMKAGIPSSKWKLLSTVYN